MKRVFRGMTFGLFVTDLGSFFVGAGGLRCGLVWMRRIVIRVWSTCVIVASADTNLNLNPPREKKDSVGVVFVSPICRDWSFLELGWYAHLVCTSQRREVRTRHGGPHNAQLIQVLG